ncbi:cysteine hydrolase [Synechococcus sp. Tobar12-5m-g]|uniref:cysteine hydrolase family protein n=1 Tax=unclassified Synechococcus TaxID=2626047 RepID=UPI0020CBF943|nr:MULTISPECIES: isochorismatase family cysteine hydrolase [unclassified Synechococcus]MCP9773283.1 cysteine hydrolase [Synechococcus sp. Tobar12-5m-g]MCP9874316.1 cysteine hydrolase [Synechococcus sp. Cruz CV-v-12]
MAPAALLLVDVQNGTCGPAGPAGNAEATPLPPSPRPPRPPGFDAHFQEAVLPRLEQALEHARSSGLEVIHTVIANLTADGRDRSLDYKRSGLGFAPGSWEARVIEALAPRPDELVLPKSSSSPFHSTNLDYILRNIGITELVVAGLLTDQCIDHTVKDAADRGYGVTCLIDACMAESAERHRAALSCFRGYCRELRVAEFTSSLSGRDQRPAPADHPPR